MTNELPGLYHIDGIKATTKAPNGTKFKTVVPLEHIAYNIVLPRIGKRIDRENYRKKIQENIRSVEFEKSSESIYDKNRKEIKISSSWTKKSRPRTAFILSDKLGAAFSNNYDISYIDASRYYNTLSVKVGEEELKDTKYSFETRNQLKEVDKLCKFFHDFEEMIHETVPEGLQEVLNNIEKGAELKSVKRRLNEFQEGIDYLKKGAENANDSFDYGIRGQVLAEIMVKKLKNEERFANPEDIFLHDSKSIVLKPKIAEKLSDEDIKLLLELYEKTNFLYHHKFCMNKKHGNLTGKEVVFNMTYSLLDDIRNQVSIMEEDESARQTYFDNLKKYNSSAC